MIDRVWFFSRKRWRSDHRFWFAVSVILLALLYWWTHWHHPSAPGGIRGPDGWYSSWDMMLYRRAARLLTELNFGQDSVFYPPLWPWSGAPFVRWIPNYTFVIPSFVFLCIHLYAVVVIGERYFGRALTYAVTAALVLFYPKLTIDQWVIPWSSSLSGALSSILFLLLYRLATKPTPWAIEGRADYATVLGFYVAYGATFATRPFDSVVLFPLALAVAIPTLWTLWQGRDVRKLIGVCAGIAIAGLALPALYLFLNVRAFGDAFGGYFQLGAHIGFILGPQLLERAVSLWIDSNAIYPNQGGAISSYFPLLIPALVLCVGATFSAPFVIRVIAGTAVLLIAAHVAFADLSPENLFPGNLMHYFKWAIPWLALIAAGTLLHYIRTRARLPLGAAVVASALIMSIRIDVIPIPVRETRDDTSGTFTLSADDAKRVYIVDTGLNGGWTVHGAHAHKLLVDGQEIKRSGDVPGILPGVNVMRTSTGTRFFLTRGVVAQSISVQFPPPFERKAEVPSRLATYRFTVACVLPRCVTLR
jgi:hypothetical protein